MAFTKIIKLIENIAEQLPPGCFLYIKDHPHRPAFRDMVYFERISLILNVKLVNPSVEGMDIIQNSKGIITISGTSGFEAILLNKAGLYIWTSILQYLK